MLRISDISSWKNFFDLIFDSCTIVELKLDQKKCKMTVLDNGHVAFYDAEYSKDFFDSYQVDDIESILVYVEDFYKILKSAHKDDELVLESDGELLKIMLEHDGSHRVFELPLGDEFGSGVPPLPSIDYDATFDILLEDLKLPCADLDKIVKTNKFTMMTNNDELSIISPADSLTRYCQKIMIDENVSMKSVVDLKYIQQLLKLNKINKNIEFSIGGDVPVKWRIISPFEDVVITGLIAPIIEQEE